MACVLCALLVILALGAALKIYIKLNTRRNGSYKCLRGKTAIVTGANTGIGYVTALDFAKRGARVILACRNKERAEDAVGRIIKATGNKDVTYRLVDMASLRSVRNFADEINKSEERLDILVNNAGIGSGNQGFTEDGVQITIQVNHVSSFLLTHLLIDKLKKSAPSRIVNVSSVLANESNLTVANLDSLNVSSPPLLLSDNMYRNSKLCIILFTSELAKRLSGSGVTANSLHPGAIYTDIFRSTKGFFKYFVGTIGRIYFWNPEEGAQTQIYLSVSEEVAKISGALFSNCKRIETYETARDADLAQKVWTMSEEFAKLSDNEKIPF